VLSRLFNAYSPLQLLAADAGAFRAVLDVLAIDSCPFITIPACSLLVNLFSNEDCGVSLCNVDTLSLGDMLHHIIARHPRPEEGSTVANLVDTTKWALWYFEGLCGVVPTYTWVDGRGGAAGSWTKSEPSPRAQLSQPSPRSMTSGRVAQAGSTGGVGSAVTVECDSVAHAIGFGYE
jgi:hypothetical protein